MPLTLIIRSQAPPFIAYDQGVPVPDDGYTYVMAQHERPLFGYTRLPENKTVDPIPAVVNASNWGKEFPRGWGIRTLTSGTKGDYFQTTPRLQRWMYRFWDWGSGYRLPRGKFEGTYVNPMNPKVVYSNYTPGSKLNLFSRMIMDAKSHSDSNPVEWGSKCVVTERNMNAAIYWDWLARPCTGALLRVILKNGVDLKIEAIDPYGVLPEPSTLKLHQFYYATQVDINGNVTRYPDVKEMFRMNGYPEEPGTVMPLLAPGGYFWIRRDAVVEMKPGSIWRPYLQKYNKPP